MNFQTQNFTIFKMWSFQVEDYPRIDSILEYYLTKIVPTSYFASIFKNTKFINLLQDFKVWSFKTKFFTQKFSLVFLNDQTLLKSKFVVSNFHYKMPGFEVFEVKFLSKLGVAAGVENRNWLYYILLLLFK